MRMLPYEEEVIFNLQEDDGLLIAARGLSIQRIFTAFLAAYCDPKCLVFVINTRAEEEQFFSKCLKRRGCEYLPRRLTFDMSSAKDRYDEYFRGGVIFASSRILVVDLLKNKVPVENITGMLVYRAHELHEATQEAFILRLYRLKNRQGFVKAFSESPEDFTRGFAKVEKIMRNLFVRKLYILPRFEASVIATLDSSKPDLEELHLEFDKPMQQVQFAILDLLDKCLKELRQCNLNVDLNAFTLNNAITSGFDRLIRTHLDPSWDMLSEKSKQLVADLRLMRRVLNYLLSYDCVTFYGLLWNLKQSIAHSNKHSGWIYLDSAEKLFVLAHERVVLGSFAAGKNADEINSKKSAVVDVDVSLLPAPPKWDCLLDIMDEIHNEDRRLRTEQFVQAGNIVIVADDQRLCNTLFTLLLFGKQRLFQSIVRRVNKIIRHREAANTRGSSMKRNASMYNSKPVTGNNADGNKRQKFNTVANKALAGNSAAIIMQRTRSEYDFDTDDAVLLESDAADPTAALIDDVEDESDDDVADKNDDVSAEAGGGDADDGDNLSSERANALRVAATSAYGRNVHTWSQIDMDPDILDPTNANNSASTQHICLFPIQSEKAMRYEFAKCLRRLKPRYVVLYSTALHAIRQLEVFHASRSDGPTRVYLLSYTNSLEEQRFLSEIQKEKEAFEYLIHEKAQMALPEDMTAELCRNMMFAQMAANSGGTNSAVANSSALARRGGNAVAGVALNDADIANVDNVINAVMPPASGAEDAAASSSRNSSGLARVIVDMREFRSELPSLLHRRGMDVEPVTLTVGDYILTPDVCVERKSINDLIGSLNKGRLYTQAQQMCRFYKIPILLIEFDTDRSFSLQRANYARSDVLRDLSNKLVLLTIHFPRLKLLWCPNPYATAELFQEIKLNRPEPKSEQAAGVSAESSDPLRDEQYNSTPKDLLMTLPGITQQNFRRVLHQVRDIAELSRMTTQRLTQVLGSQANAKLLFDFFRRKFKTIGGGGSGNGAASTTTNGAGGGRGGFKRGFYKRPVAK